MAQNKTIKIAFPNGGIIPADLLKNKEDKKVPPHEKVVVPFSYGKSLCDDKFAYEVKSEASSSKDQKPPTKQKASTKVEKTVAEREAKTAEIKTRYEQAVAVLEQADGEGAVKAAQAAVDLIKGEIAKFAASE